MKLRKRYRKADPLIPVEKPQAGAKYHVSWGYSRGVVGVCTHVDYEKRTVILRTPKTKKVFKYPVPFEQLRHIRAHQQRLEEQK